MRLDTVVADADILLSANVGKATASAASGSSTGSHPGQSWRSSPPGPPLPASKGPPISSDPSMDVARIGLLSWRTQIRLVLDWFNWRYMKRPIPLTGLVV